MILLVVEQQRSETVLFSIDLVGQNSVLSVCVQVLESGSGASERKGEVSCSFYSPYLMLTPPPFSQ